MAGPKTKAGPARSAAMKGADVILALLLVSIAALGAQLIVTLRAHQHMRMDIAELDDVKYGLLNADVWVSRVTAIIKRRVNESELTGENRASVKKALEHVLDVLITQADLYVRQRNADGFTGSIKESIREKLIDVDEVKAGIPGYADKIIDALNQPEARRDLNAFLANLLSSVSRSTFAEVDKRPIAAIQSAYNCGSRATCHDAIEQRLHANHIRAVQLALGVVTLSVLLFVGGWLRWRRTTTRAPLAMLVLCCGLLAACGVLTPMIEVEARISSLQFMLLGEPVKFDDQVLYFQSKSVLDVVRVLTSTGKVDMIAVGILVMTFSVVFPIAKLTASFVYLYDLRGLRRNKVIEFFTLKSAKWSMADVFVVAMFMAYIGFSGLIASQLSTFALAAKANVDVLTTNGTSLQIGFFMFLAFCIAGLATSTLIDAASRRDGANAAH
jgi:hypothetical protein